MTTYRVRWEIDVDAETPALAALQAHGHAARPGTTATVYDVQSHDGIEPPQTVDVGDMLAAIPACVNAARNLIQYMKAKRYPALVIYTEIIDLFNVALPEMAKRADGRNAIDSTIRVAARRFTRGAAI